MKVNQEYMRIGISIPEAWRVRLMMGHRTEPFLNAISDSGLYVLDWNDPIPSRVIVANLDTSTAEVILKLPPSTKCVLITRKAVRFLPIYRFRRNSLERRALGRPDLVLVPLDLKKYRDEDLIENPRIFLERAVSFFR